MRTSCLLLAGLLVVSSGLHAQTPPSLPRGPVSPPPTVNPAAREALRNAGVIPANIPADRPTRRLLAGMIVAANGDKGALRRAIENANVTLKVRRLCHVSAGYPGKAVCVNAADIIAELQRSAADTQLMIMSLNDLWESLSNRPEGGDIDTCAGRSAASVTNIVASVSSGGLAGFGGSLNSNRSVGGLSAPGGLGRGTSSTAGTIARQTLDGGAAANKVSACRSAQRASLGGSMGTRNVPGSPAYREAVARAQTFLTGVADSCSNRSNNGLIAAGSTGTTNPPRNDPPPPPATQPPEKKPGAAADANKAISTAEVVTNVTNDVLQSGSQILEHCGTSKFGCGVAVVTAALGAAASLDLIKAGADGTDPNAPLQEIDLVADIGGAAVEFIIAAGTAGEVTLMSGLLPAVGAGVFGYSITSSLGVGQAIANSSVVSNVTGALADGLWSLKNSSSSNQPPTQRPGAGQPREEGMSCADMAAAAARFNQYCSQPGNDWQSFDCMSYVALLNGCADPGVITPAPGEDYQCRVPNDAPEKQRANLELSCKHRGKIRGWLIQGMEGTAPAGSNLGTCIDTGVSQATFERSFQAEMCKRVSIEDTSGICGGIRSRSQSNTSNTR